MERDGVPPLNNEHREPGVALRSLLNPKNDPRRVKNLNAPSTRIAINAIRKLNVDLFGRQIFMLQSVTSHYFSRLIKSKTKTIINNKN